ncbi:MAG TPA: formate dehydrogenase, partial [Reyranella sp.]|nr:formate dehydrogenase [Reyranella sp.]
MSAVKIYVPGDSSAVAVGANKVAQAIERLAREKNREIQIVRNGSRGLYWLEPMVEVVTAQGRIAYGPVAPGDVQSLFEHDFLNGGGHGLCLGKPEEIPFLKNQERLMFARCGITDPLSIEEYRANGGYRGLAKALQMQPEQVVAEVTESGLRGRGGAGFPTGIKWNTVLKAEADRKYIVCNADEGDSGTFADRMIMEGDPFLLIEGMTIAGVATGATKGFIYIRSEYPDAFRQMGRAIEIARNAGYLGPNVLGSGKAFDLETRLGAGAYICGEETSLLESLEGKRGVIRFKPPLPAIKGLFGKPTVINNVLSFTSVPCILDDGAAFYKNYGMGRSRGTQPFQLAGNLKQGGLVEKAFGVTLKELVYDFG